MTAPVADVPAVRIMVYSPQRTCWAVHKIVTSKRDLDDALRALPRTTKVRLLPAKAVRACVVKPPPPATAAREHRIAAAMAMSDRADANKHYKSPGVDTRLMF